MNKATGIRRLKWALCGSLMLGLASPVFAQEPSTEHLAAARQAIKALGATQQFDAILPNAAQGLKASLIQTAPNYQEIISATVDETALSMVGRRADLEREAASIYAKNFSVDDLNAITAFYESPAGKKLLETGPIVTRELLRAAEVWSNGISRDLTIETETSLRATLGEKPGDGTPGTDAPANGSGGN